jgi:hypothetical protein
VQNRSLRPKYNTAAGENGLKLLSYVQPGAEVFKSVHPHRHDRTSDVANVVHCERRMRLPPEHADGCNGSDGTGGGRRRQTAADGIPD